MTEDDIEAAIELKGLHAPRLTPELIDSAIAAADYYRFPGTTVTVCCLTLNNGFTVIGQSATVSAANFDADLGRKIAHADARDKVWQLEGYLLRERLAEGGA